MNGTELASCIAAFVMRHAALDFAMRNGNTPLQQTSRIRSEPKWFRRNHIERCIMVAGSVTKKDDDKPAEKPVEKTAAPPTPEPVKADDRDNIVGEKHTDGRHFVDEYVEEVEAELDAYEEQIKAVREQLSAVKSQRAGERDFAPLRAAMHDLAHGKPVSRVARTAYVRHDGPEELRKAPNAHTNMSSGPGEENNPETDRRIVGK